MGISLSFTLPPSLTDSGKLKKIEDQKRSILLEGSTALQELLQEHMRMLATTRGRYSSGKVKHHFKPEDVLDPKVEGDSVSVGITTPGITRALHDIVIRPVEAQMLAIPLHADAYGMQPREYNLVHPKGTKDALFFIKSRRGNLFLAKKDGRELVLMYILKDVVHQNQDPSLLPTDQQMEQAVLDAIHNAVQYILQT